MIHVIDRFLNVLQSRIGSDDTASTIPTPQTKVTKACLLPINPEASNTALLHIDKFWSGVHDEVEGTLGDGGDDVWKYSILINELDIYKDGSNNIVVVMSFKYKKTILFLQ